jgi:hypothetical protein
MKNNQAVELLEKLLNDASEREKVHLEQLHQQSEQIRQLSARAVLQTEQLDRLSLLLKEQTQTIQSLEGSLLEKGKNLTSLSGKNRGLTKLLKGNESEKMTLGEDSADAVEKEKAPTPKERGNNQAKRKEHFDLEEEIVEIWPESENVDALKAHIIGYVDSIRYTFIPCKFKKTIYRQYNCKFADKILSGTAPRALFMNSNYDASFIAGMMQYRYIYTMPVERIINQFNENGFELNKATAHGLIAKASVRLDELHGVLRRAIHEDPYIRMDETYHNVLTDEKNTKGKGIRKGYIWSAMADTYQLVHFFYKEGSREKVVFLDYLEKSYRGAVHTDGLACYKQIETDDFPDAIRISCIQHSKRKFLDIENDDQAGEIIDLINQLYQIEHTIAPEAIPKQKLRERNKKAPPILKSIKKKLLAIKNDPQTLPSTPLATATNYMLGEYDAICNYLHSPNYTLDNNPNERANRYISMSRRSSLFFGSHEGARRSALLYSLACSCRLHHINAFEYFTDLLGKMAYIKPNAPYEVLRELLPDRWKKQIHE